MLAALEEAAALKAEGRVRDHHDTSNSLDRLERGRSPTC